MAGYNQSRYVEELLERNKSSPPSFTVHLHTDYWTLNNGGKFLYNNQIASLLDDVRARRIPVDFLDLFDKARVPFYDGCMIVEILDYRPQKASEPALETPERTRTVLHPNGESLYADICLLNSNHGGKWTDREALEIEARILLATSPALCLDPNPHLTRIANHVIRASTPTVPLSLKRKAAALDPEEDETDKARKLKIMQFMSPRNNKPHAPNYRILDVIDRRKSEQHNTPTPTATPVNTQPLSQSQPFTRPPSQQSVPIQPNTQFASSNHSSPGSHNLSGTQYTPAHSPTTNGTADKKLPSGAQTFVVNRVNGTQTPVPAPQTSAVGVIPQYNQNHMSPPGQHSPSPTPVLDPMRRTPTPRYSQSPRVPSTQLTMHPPQGAVIQPLPQPTSQPPQSQPPNPAPQTQPQHSPHLQPPQSQPPQHQQASPGQGQSTQSMHPMQPPMHPHPPPHPGQHPPQQSVRPPSAASFQPVIPKSIPTLQAPPPPKNIQAKAGVSVQPNTNSSTNPNLHPHPAPSAPQNVQPNPNQSNPSQPTQQQHSTQQHPKPQANPQMGLTPQQQTARLQHYRHMMAAQAAKSGGRATPMSMPTAPGMNGQTNPQLAAAAQVTGVGRGSPLISNQQLATRSPMPQDPRNTQGNMHNVNVNVNAMNNNGMNVNGGGGVAMSPTTRPASANPNVNVNQVNANQSPRSGPANMLGVLASGGVNVNSPRPGAMNLNANSSPRPGGVTQAALQQWFRMNPNMTPAQKQQIVQAFQAQAQAQAQAHSPNGAGDGQGHQGQQGQVQMQGQSGGVGIGVGQGQIQNPQQHPQQPQQVHPTPSQRPQQLTQAQQVQLQALRQQQVHNAQAARNGTPQPGQGGPQLIAPAGQPGQGAQGGQRQYQMYYPQLPAPYMQTIQQGMQGVQGGVPQGMNVQGQFPQAYYTMRGMPMGMVPGQQGQGQQGQGGQGPGQVMNGMHGTQAQQQMMQAAVQMKNQMQGR